MAQGLPLPPPTSRIGDQDGLCTHGLAGTDHGFERQNTESLRSLQSLSLSRLYARRPTQSEQPKQHRYAPVSSVTSVLLHPLVLIPLPIKATIGV